MFWRLGLLVLVNMPAIWFHVTTHGTISENSSLAPRSRSENFPGKLRQSSRKAKYVSSARMHSNGITVSGRSASARRPQPRSAPDCETGARVAFPARRPFPRSSQSAGSPTGKYASVDSAPWRAPRRLVFTVLRARKSKTVSSPRKTSSGNPPTCCHSCLRKAMDRPCKTWLAHPR